jgi:hypothetical protein
VKRLVVGLVLGFLLGATYERERMERELCGGRQQNWGG